MVIEDGYNKIEFTSNRFWNQITNFNTIVSDSFGDKRIVLSSSFKWR